MLNPSSQRSAFSQQHGVLPKKVTQLKTISTFALIIQDFKTPMLYIIYS
jgi:hypothetical protein